MNIFKKKRKNISRPSLHPRQRIKVKNWGIEKLEKLMAALMYLECGYPLIDSDFRNFCASHNIISVEDFLLHDLYVLVISTEQHHNSERLKEVLTIINKQHQPWVDGQELLDDALQNKRFLPTGCRSIDTFLHGGLREGYLTELVGTSSSGKTQICLQAASAVAKSWGKIIFLDSGNSFSPKRVAQIVTQTSDLSAYEVDKALQEVMNNIVCFSVFDIFTLFEVLHQLKNNLRSQKDQHIRMLIIDSISSLIAPVLGGGAHGHALMVSVGFLLKRLAHEHDISILVTNHMVAGEKGTSKPALGESWRSIPHIRLLLSKDQISNISSISVLRHPHMATGDRVEFAFQ
ncbi:DNA repair protein RAD51 homolog 4 isoform X2 [Solanum lycopersicum]|uniref:DNA repair protein RAD51 homolog 4 isoform X2 n=1 Tax=Solanum lycopersicum TaxID=4081 RepID=UPI003747DF4A